MAVRKAKIIEFEKNHAPQGFSAKNKNYKEFSKGRLHFLENRRKAALLQIFVLFTYLVRTIIPTSEPRKGLLGEYVSSVNEQNCASE